MSTEHGDWMKSEAYSNPTFAHEADYTVHTDTTACVSAAANNEMQDPHNTEVNTDCVQVSISPEGQPSLERKAPDSHVLARLHNVKFFLFIMCCFTVAQAFAVNGINSVNIPAYERRFGLSSTQSGLEASFYDIVFGFVVFFVGCFGTRFHQPRLLGLASVLLAIGSLTMSLPHFISADYRPRTTSAPVCVSAGLNLSLDDGCGTTEEGLSNYLYVLLLGQGLHGIAGTILYVIGPAYIDGSVSTRQSPLYLGIFFGSATLGPAIGYILGGQLLDIYVDHPKLPPRGLTPESPGWVGAWWIGFLITVGIAILMAVPLFVFPRILPGTEERREGTVNEVHDHSMQHLASENGFSASMKDMPAALKLLLYNPVFVCMCLLGGSETLLVGGMATFLPKFIANQFNITAKWSSLLTGFLAVPAAAIGNLLGGLIVRKFNLKVKDILKYNLICSGITIIFAAAFWIKCDQSNIAGVVLPYAYNRSTERLSNPVITTKGANLTAACNVGCSCKTSQHEPWCYNGVEYFSLCHAGCPVNLSTLKPDLNSCSCLVREENATVYEEISEGKCKGHCHLLYIFLVMGFIAFLATFMIEVPSVTVTLRCVSDKQRTLALSIQQICMRFLGGIPGPLLFGAVLDSVCLAWQERCDEKGSCWIYDNDKMGQNFYILMIGCKAVTIVCTLISYKFYRPPNTNDAGKSYISESDNDNGQKHVFTETNN